MKVGCELHERFVAQTRPCSWVRGLIGLALATGASTHADVINWVGYQYTCSSPLNYPDEASFHDGSPWLNFVVPGDQDVAQFGSGFDPGEPGFPNLVHFGDFCWTPGVGCPNDNFVPTPGAWTVMRVEIQHDDFTFDFGPVTQPGANCIDDPVNAGELSVTDLVVGMNRGLLGPGNASLTIRDGVVYASTVVIADGASTQGTITIDGADGFAALYAAVNEIGNGGSAELIVTNGGRLGGDVSLSNRATLVITGVGSQLGARARDGGHSVSDGGASNDARGLDQALFKVLDGGIAYNSGVSFSGDSSDITFTIRDPGTLWELAGAFQMGSPLEHHLQILNGARLSVGGAFHAAITNNAAAVVLVSNDGGQQAIFDIGDDCTLAANPGSRVDLTLTDGARIDIGDRLDFGHPMAAGGTFLIEQFSELNVGGHVVLHGPVTTHLRDGADVTFGEYVALGGYSDLPQGPTPSTLRLEDLGTTLTLSGVLQIGENRDAALIVDDAATLDVAESIYAGSAPGVNASIQVSGGAIFAGPMHAFVVGSVAGAEATLSVTDGGDVESFYGTVGASGVGAATLDGAGSRWTCARNFNVGRNDGGDGTLLISDGAELDVIDRAWVGELEGSTGFVELTNGGRWTCEGPTYIGYAGDGTMHVRSGSTVESETALVALGQQIGGVGRLVIDGAGSQVVAEQGVTAGVLGNGDIEVTNGARLWSRNEPVNVALTAESTASLSVAGAASQILCPEGLGVGGNIGVSVTGGKGTLRVINDARIIAPVGGLTIFRDGRAEIDGLVFANAAGLTNAGDFFPGADGAVGTTQIVGPLDLAGGAVGRTGRLVLDLLNPLSHDVITCDDATLGGSLELRLLPGADPAVGESFDLIAATAFTGAFDVIHLPELPPGRGFELQLTSPDVRGLTTLRAVVVSDDPDAPFGDATSLSIEGALSTSAKAVHLNDDEFPDLAIVVQSDDPNLSGVAVLLNLGVDQLSGDWLGFDEPVIYAQGISDPLQADVGEYDLLPGKDIAILTRNELLVLRNDANTGAFLLPPQEVATFDTDPGAYAFDIRSTFYRTCEDPAPVPVAIDLDALGYVPGDIVRITSVGDFNFTADGPEKGTGAVGVFSSDGIVDPDRSLQFRVPGAIQSDAAPVFTEGPIRCPELPTDIPEDFICDGAPITIPDRGDGRAPFLITTAFDVYYSDNVDADDNFRVVLTGPPDDPVDMTVTARAIVVVFDVDEGEGFVRPYYICSIAGVPCVIPHAGTVIPPNPTKPKTTDLDNDKDLEIVIAHRQSDLLTILRNIADELPPGRGDSGFDPPVTINVGFNPVAIFVQPTGLDGLDFNADGFTDIGVLSAGSGQGDAQLRLLFGDGFSGGGPFPASTTRAVSDGPLAIGAAGGAAMLPGDLLVASLEDPMVTGEVRRYALDQQTGALVVSDEGLVSQLADAEILVTADLNGDGQLDVIGLSNDDAARAERSDLAVLLRKSVCSGDADGDGAVNFADLQLLLEYWGESVPVGQNGDVNDSGGVDFLDLQLLLETWGCG